METVAQQLARISHANGGWTTVDELKFVRDLGTFASTHGLTRAQLLSRYEAALRLREHWGSIDAIKVRVAVARANKREERA
jgi:hypothetical protein